MYLYAHFIPNITTFQHYSKDSFESFISKSSEVCLKDSVQKIQSKRFSSRNPNAIRFAEK